ncbi:MAG TPA: ferrous iron transport protein A [Mogibacterium sp.]|nr:ferrous iron transport protein A [Mogibacterium sp.]
MTLAEAEVCKDYIIKDVHIEDEDLSAFLFRLGCYAGENITVISRKNKNCVVAIKDARYNIDNHLAEAIIV